MAAPKTTKEKQVYNRRVMNALNRGDKAYALALQREAAGLAGAPRPRFTGRRRIPTSSAEEAPRAGAGRGIGQGVGGGRALARGALRGSSPEEVQAQIDRLRANYVGRGARPAVATKPPGMAFPIPDVGGARSVPPGTLSPDLLERIKRGQAGTMKHGGAVKPKTPKPKVGARRGGGAVGGMAAGGRHMMPGGHMMPNAAMMRNGGAAKPKLTKAQSAKASAKISHLASTEPHMPRDQKVAMAMGMAREGRLGARGGYMRTPPPPTRRGTATRRATSKK